jgi:mannose PTS system EIIA component
MVAVLVISEGKTAVEMLRGVKKVLGKRVLKGMEAICLKSSFTKRTLQSKLNKIINKHLENDGVLILTDIYGSTQSNVCCSLLEKGQIELLSGYNMPMLIKAATLNQKSSLKELAKHLTDTGKKYIKHYKEQ